MKLIPAPKSLAERIVNAVCADIYGRSGGDDFFDNVEFDVMEREFIPELVAIVNRELSATPTPEHSK